MGATRPKKISKTKAVYWKAREIQKKKYSEIKNQRQSKVPDHTNILFEKVNRRSCDPSRKGGDAPTKSDCKALVNVVVPNYRRILM